VTVSGITTATAIKASAGSRTCALLSGGTVKCWGENGEGGLGDGTTTTRTAPVAVSGVANATAIAMGQRDGCAVISGGAVKCWGSNSYGQLADGTSGNNRLVGTTASGITTATAVGIGDRQICYVLSGGSVKCAGETFHAGQTLSPSTVSGITTASGISLGLYHACALLSGGSVKCWGYNSVGQLGIGTVANLTLPSTAVSGITTATSIASGQYSNCALLSDQTVKCWGDNSNGQIGNGKTSSDRLTPGPVSGLSSVTNVAAGQNYTCAIVSGGAVKCWGENSNGQLGDGTHTTSMTPVTTSGIANATAISVVSAGDDNSYTHTCVIISGGTVKCWGSNGDGQLGDGTNDNQNTPVTVSGISTASGISVGLRHTCAVLTNGTVKCWGRNADGQLGDGTNDDQNTPVTVSDISNAVAVAAGANHTCALLANHSVKCWGQNDAGQLGNNDWVGSNTPVMVMEIGTAVSIGSGDRYSCALLSGRGVRCWGLNDD
jgi:alpha-tubulin suppressor-like RCC1 family protein